MGSYVFNESDSGPSGELNPASPVPHTDFSVIAKAYAGDPESLWQVGAVQEFDVNGFVVGSAAHEDEKRRGGLSDAVRSFEGIAQLQKFLEGIFSEEDISAVLLEKRELDAVDLVYGADDARSATLPALLIKGGRVSRNRVIVGDQAIQDYLRANGIDPTKMDGARYERTTVRGIVDRPDFKIQDYKQAFIGEVTLDPRLAETLRKYPERAKFVEAARLKAREFGLNEIMFVNQIYAESGFNPSVISPAGAIGLGQLMPQTAKALGVNPYNPLENLHGAAQLMAKLTVKYGRQEIALAAYNGGDKAVLYPMRSLGITNPKELTPEMFIAFYAEEKLEMRRSGRPLRPGLWCVETANYVWRISGAARRDYSALAGYNPDVAVKRTQTIARGDAHDVTTPPAATAPAQPVAVPAAANGAAAGQPAPTPPTAAAEKPTDKPAVAEVTKAAQGITAAPPVGKVAPPGTVAANREEGGKPTVAAAGKGITAAPEIHQVSSPRAVAANETAPKHEVA